MVALSQSADNADTVSGLIRGCSVDVTLVGNKRESLEIMEPEISSLRPLLDHSLLVSLEVPPCYRAKRTLEFRVSC